MYRLIKPLLFLFSPERAHHLTFWALDLAASVAPLRALLRRWYCTDRPDLARTVMGLRFPNPVGLAAGFDKDGKHIDGLALLGFGFIEVGTVTPLPQEGNPKPRLFRLPDDEAIINRMGFNNEGLEALVARLRALRERGPAPRQVIIGGNIGKNKVTPNEQADNDYIRCFEALFEVVDYFVVNVSSPNTPNLRDLQEKAPLTHLLQTLQTLNQAKAVPKPILLKIAPDLTNSQLDDIADIVRTTGIAGVIATNTTIDRSGLRTSPPSADGWGPGGLSGQPLTGRSTEVIRYLRTLLGPEPVIIGVGGIHDAATAKEKFEAGANLIQVYTGLIYEGPGLVKAILNE